MQDPAYLGEFTAAIFYLIFGVRLARLAIQTRETPESLLAAMFLSCGLAYVLYTIPAAIHRESLWDPFNFVARVAYVPAPILIAMFTREVFRRNAVWAASIAYGSAVLLVTGVMLSALQGHWDGFSIADPGFWLEWVGYTLPFAWAGLEAFAEYRKARLRLPLGLCEPIVCHRLLLWSLFGALQLGTSLVVLPQYAEFDRNGVFAATWDFLGGAMELLSAAAVCLIVFDPAVYRRWVNRVAKV